MLGRGLTMVPNSPMFRPLEVDSNAFQEIKMQFRRAGAKFAETANGITDIRTTSNIGIHKLTK